MPRQLIKDELANEDLIEIWLFSHQQWGLEQAERYLDALEAAIGGLTNTPAQGKRRDAVRRGYWSIRVKRHVVFYTFDDQTVHIRRVLHDRMDVGRHL